MRKKDRGTGFLVIFLAAKKWQGKTYRKRIESAQNVESSPY